MPCRLGHFLVALQDGVDLRGAHREFTRGLARGHCHEGADCARDHQSKRGDVEPLRVVAEEEPSEDEEGRHHGQGDGEVDDEGVERVPSGDGGKHGSVRFEALGVRCG